MQTLGEFLRFVIRVPLKVVIPIGRYNGIFGQKTIEDNLIHLLCRYTQILLLLKLDKQIGGNIYWPFLAMNIGTRHRTWRGCGAVHMPSWTSE